MVGITKKYADMYSIHAQKAIGQKDKVNKKAKLWKREKHLQCIKSPNIIVWTMSELNEVEHATFFTSCLELSNKIGKRGLYDEYKLIKTLIKKGNKGVIFN